MAEGHNTRDTHTHEGRMLVCFVRVLTSLGLLRLLFLLVVFSPSIVIVCSRSFVSSISTSVGV